MRKLFYCLLSFLICAYSQIYTVRTIDNSEWEGGLRKKVNVNETQFISAVCYYFKLFCPYNYTKHE